MLAAYGISKSIDSLAELVFHFVALRADHASTIPRVIELTARRNDLWFETCEAIENIARSTFSTCTCRLSDAFAPTFHADA